MIQGKSISVIVTTYRRFGSIRRIVNGWLAEPVEQVWLADGSGGGARDKVADIADPRFGYWALGKDTHTRSDYALATLTDGDFVLLADDDVLPKEGFSEELMRGWKTVSQSEPAIVGIIGRKFVSPDYYKTEFFAANKIELPVRTGFAGVVYFSPRQFFGFDTRGMGRNCDDLWWHMQIHPTVPKFVVPAKRYENLPESRNGMFHDQDLRAERAAYYERMYRQNYEPWGRDV